MKQQITSALYSLRDAINSNTTTLTELIKKANDLNESISNLEQKEISDPQLIETLKQQHNDFIEQILELIKHSQKLMLTYQQLINAYN